MLHCLEGVGEQVRAQLLLLLLKLLLQLCEIWLLLLLI